jgi:polyisoprenoid-binding protein YceI
MKRLLLLAFLAAPFVAHAAVDPTQDAAPKTFKVDPQHSSVVFHIEHLGLNFVHGRFNAFDGEFAVDPEQPDSQAACHIEIQTASIDTAVSARDDHLRGADFFNVDKYPTMTFESTGWEQTGENTFELTGKFTLLGTTKEITVPVRYQGAATGRRDLRTGFTTAFTILRSEYGMTKHTDGSIGDTVHITLDIQGIHEAPAEDEEATEGGAEGE